MTQFLFISLGPDMWVAAAAIVCATIASCVTFEFSRRRSLREGKRPQTRSGRGAQVVGEDASTDEIHRAEFEDQVREAVLRGERKDRAQVAVLAVALDGVKPVTDSFGEAASDIIIETAARRLSDAARIGSTVARAGSEGFLVLLENLEEGEGRTALLDRILATLQRPFEVLDRSLHVACSMGVAVYSDQRGPAELVPGALAAMSESKRAGGGAYVMFEAPGVVDTSDQIQLQADLRKAVEQRQVELYYQPKINARRNRMTGVEALVRWNHPRLGLLRPDRFIALAERHGLMVRLGEWILNEACAQVAAWSESGLYLRVSINLSAAQLRDPTLADKVEEALRRHNILGAQLLCEISESVAMMNSQATKRTFEQLANLGVFCSIDDFGTRYSSLNELCELRARQLKIDRSFVQDLETNEGTRFFVAAMINLAHSFGLTLVAEGVETAGQRDILLGLGCDELQGFFYARPMRASSVAVWGLEDCVTPPSADVPPPTHPRRPILGAA